MSATSTTYSYPFNVKVKKQPCIFYDALIRSKIEQFIANNIPGQEFPERVRGMPNRRNDSYEYYKQVFDDKYGESPTQQITHNDISEFLAPGMVGSDFLKICFSEGTGPHDFLFVVGFNGYPNAIKPC